MYTQLPYPWNHPHIQLTISNRSKSGGRKRKKKHRKNKGHHSKKQSFNNRYGKMTGYNFQEFQ